MYALSQEYKRALVKFRAFVFGEQKKCKYQMHLSNEGNKETTYLLKSICIRHPVQPPASINLGVPCVFLSTWLRPRKHHINLSYRRLGKDFKSCNLSAVMLPRGIWKLGSVRPCYNDFSNFLGATEWGIASIFYPETVQSFGWTGNFTSRENKMNILEIADSPAQCLSYMQTQLYPTKDYALTIGYKTLQ